MQKKLLPILGALSILLSVILFSCAKEAMPQGGARDSIPPKLLWSKPEQLATGFKGKKIILRFDEYFELKDLNKNLFSSPPFSKPPKLIIRGKRLIIKLPDQLRDSVTYTIGLGNAIVDFHEGNVLKDFKFVFSTYDQIDSLRIYGKVVDAKTLKPVPDVNVMLYKNADDSVVFKQLPVYITRSNDSGNFVIFGIKSGVYKVFALKDLNNNFLYDGIENYIAYLDTLVEPKITVDTILDTVQVQHIVTDSAGNVDTITVDSAVRKPIVHYQPFLLLRMFKENNRPQSVVAAERPYNFLVKIRFNLPLIDNFYRLWLINPDSALSDSLVSQYFYDSDSLWIWLKNPKLQQADSLTFVFQLWDPIKNGKRLILDTIGVGLPVDSVHQLLIEPLMSKINFFDSIVLNTNVLLDSVDWDRIHLIRIKDTAVYKPKLPHTVCLRTDPNLIQVLLQNKILPNSIYALSLNPLQQLTNLWYDSAQNIINIKVPKDLAMLDTLYVYLMFRAKRLSDYAEPFICRKALTLVKQEIKRTQWLKPKQITLFFAKPLKQVQISGLDTERVQIARRQITLYLKQFTDTVSFTVRALDFTDLSVHPIYFERTVGLRYHWVANKPEQIARPKRDSIIIVFSKSLDSVAAVQPLEVSGPGTLVYSVSDNRLFIRVLNKKLKQMKFFNLRILHLDHNGDSLVWLTDTVQVELGKNPLLRKTIYPEQVAFQHSTDTLNPLNFVLKAQLKPKSNYVILIYPKALTDISAQTNDTLIPLKITTTSEADYGSLKLVIIDSAKITQNTTLILNLLKNDKLIRQTIVRNQDTLEIRKLPSGNYKLQIILDKNNNRRWDTGNYLRSEQPETVLIYPKQIMIKAGWETEEHIYIK